MNILKDIFGDLATLQEYVPGVASDTSLAELNSSALGAIKQIKNVISPAIYDKILAAPDSPIREGLLSAIGNLTLHKAIIFEVVSRRLSGKDTEVYKSEREAMERHYSDNYFSAMDSVFGELASLPFCREEWEETDYCRSSEKLLIKTAAEFDSLYGIDMSYLFFFRTIYIQSELLDETFSEYSVRIAARREVFETRLKRALAQMTVAFALIRFDIVELPPAIRSLFADQKAFRHGSTEKDTAIRLAQSLTDKAWDTLRAIDAALTESSSGEVYSGSAVNRPGDKEFLMA
jgi:hypothetical protein